MHKNIHRIIAHKNKDLGKSTGSLVNTVWYHLIIEQSMK